MEFKRVQNCQLTLREWRRFVAPAALWPPPSCQRCRRDCNEREGVEFKISRQGRIHTRKSRRRARDRPSRRPSWQTSPSPISCASPAFHSVASRWFLRNMGKNARVSFIKSKRDTNFLTIVRRTDSLILVFEHRVLPRHLLLQLLRLHLFFVKDDRRDRRIVLAERRRNTTIIFRTVISGAKCRSEKHSRHGPLCVVFPNGVLPRQ